MKRRDFLAVAGGATAVSMISTVKPVFAERTTSLYATGLVMLSFDDTQFRLGFPKAPGHDATLDVTAQSGQHRLLNLKGTGSVENVALSAGRPRMVIPELIRLQEIWGDDIRSRVKECPVVINIPYSAIRNISTVAVSPVRYTFVRKDTGQEVETFRARKIAETLKIDLSSAGVLKLDGGKLSIPLDGVSELHASHSPEAGTATNSGDVFADHFHHYLHYVDRPPAADFDVLPRKLAGDSPAANVGNRFYPPWYFCFAVGL
jgi:hypothetical protein